MKANLFISILGFLFLFSCKEDNNELNSLTYRAQVLGSNIDCGIYSIKFTSDLHKVKQIAGESPEGIYIAKNLPYQLQQPGINIRLDIRSIQHDELGACTTLGPAYPWLFVIKAEKEED